MTQITKEAIDAAKAALVKYSVLMPVDAAISDAISAALPFLPIAGEGKVKALEWKDEGGEYIAQSVIGWFHIGRPASYWNLTTPHGVVSSHETRDEAKAAAQTDYEALILSALSSSPGKDGGQEVEAEPIGYGYAPEMQSGKGGFWVSWEESNSYDTPVYCRPQPASVLSERLQAIIDWCDLALKNPQEFDSHGVRLLDGPVFDEARLALAIPQPASTALVEAMRPHIGKLRVCVAINEAMGRVVEGQADATRALITIFDALFASQSTSREGER